jgi:hypothetical protein
MLRGCSRVTLETAPALENVTMLQAGSVFALRELSFYGGFDFRSGWDAG